MHVLATVVLSGRTTAVHYYRARPGEERVCMKESRPCAHNGRFLHPDTTEGDFFFFCEQQELLWTGFSMSDLFRIPKTRTRPILKRFVVRTQTIIQVIS